MEIFKKMFAEKILSFHEGTNRSLEILTKMPLVGEYISNQVIHKRNSKMRMTIGVMAVLVRMIVQFIKKYLYVAVFIYLPYLFMAQFNPLIRDHKESAVLFMFFMLSTICGSLANNIDPIFQIGKASLTPEIIEALDAALEKRELIKVSVLKNCIDDPKEIASVIAERTHSNVVKVIGKKMIFYRKAKKNPKIKLPE